MEPSAAEVDSPNKAPDSPPKPAHLSVKYSKERAFGDERRRLYQPTRRQVVDARSWLVRVIARRAVEILKAQETIP